MLAFLPAEPLRWGVRRGAAVLDRHILKHEHMFVGGRQHPVDRPPHDQRAGEPLEELAGHRAVHVRVVPVRARGALGYDEFHRERLAGSDDSVRIVDARGNV